MNRYLVFGGEYYYPGRGGDNLLRVFSDGEGELAIQFAKDVTGKFAVTEWWGGEGDLEECYKFEIEWVQVYDINTKTVIYGDGYTTILAIAG